jgi:hypothetical protein
VLCASLPRMPRVRFVLRTSRRRRDRRFGAGLSAQRPCSTSHGGSWHERWGGVVKKPAPTRGRCQRRHCRRRARRRGCSGGRRDRAVPSLFHDRPLAFAGLGRSGGSRWREPSPSLRINGYRLFASDRYDGDRGFVRLFARDGRASSLAQRWRPVVARGRYVL